MKAFYKFFFFAILPFLVCCSGSSDKPENPQGQPPLLTNEVDVWLTRSDETVKLIKQTNILAFGTSPNIYNNIDVNESQTFQTIDGFGYTLTGGSAEVINSLNPTKKAELLQDLFNTTTGIGISYLRLSIGASDLNSFPFTYNDMPSGQTDPTLANFSIAQDMNGVVALMKQILLINPNIKILATPWTAPLWMKTNNSFVGGSLQAQYYGVYAQYFVKYIQRMQTEGIVIDAITPQNEPLHGGNNPSMLMSAVEQRNFIKNNLGPSFQAAGLSTKIITYDHNCDVPEYPMSILADPAAFTFVNGSAFHLYDAGVNIAALSTVKNAYPTKDVYFTEQFTASNGNFGQDLRWHIKNVVIGSMRNWSKNTLQWNLANNANFGPFTNGGCTTCKGAITVNSPDAYVKNVGYYNIAHASKFVPQGSVRISSNNFGNISSVAFKTPAGKKVLLAVNDGTTSEIFNIRFNGKWITTSLDSGSVATYVW